jgi:hypothetical protein
MSYWSTNYLLLNPPKFLTFDLSGVQYMNYGDIMNIRNSWNLFESVTACNIQVSTSLSLGTTSFVKSSSENNGLFYQFQSNADLLSFRRGQLYHINRYPYIDFSTMVQMPPDTGASDYDTTDSCSSNNLVTHVASSSEHLMGVATLTNYAYTSTLTGLDSNAKRYFRSYQDYITSVKGCVASFVPPIIVAPPPPPPPPTIKTSDLILHFEANQPTSWPGSGSIWYNIGTGGPKYNAILVGNNLPVYFSTPIKSFQFEYNQTAYTNNYKIFNFIACKRPPSIGDDFTFCAWIQTTNVGYGFNHFNLMQIVSTETGGVNNDFGFGIDAAGYLAFGNGLLAGTDITVSSPIPVNTGNWIFVAVTRQKSNGKVILYINDSPVLTSVCNIGNTLDVAGYILFGTEADFPGFTFGGSIAAILGNTSVLTPAQILQNYNIQKNNYLGVTPYVSPFISSGRSLTGTIDGPQDVYPAVSLVGVDAGFDIPTNSQMVIMDTAYYDVPAGFTFLSGWKWSLYDSSLFTVSKTNRTGDTITAKGASINIAVGDRIIRVGQDKVMFSVKHTIWCGFSGNDGVGVGSAIVTYLGAGNFMGYTDVQSSGWYDDGSFWANGAPVGSNYITFQKNTQIIDVLVDYVADQMWYRVSGGPWQG